MDQGTVEAIVDFFRGLVCLVVGHKWYVPPYMIYWHGPVKCAVFCERCGKELI